MIFCGACSTRHLITPEERVQVARARQSPEICPQRDGQAASDDDAPSRHPYGWWKVLK